MNADGVAHNMGDPRQPNFFVRGSNTGGSIQYDDDKQSVKTASNAHTIESQGHMGTLDVRSEYSGIRGVKGPVTLSVNPQNMQSLNAQPMRANTIHRALMGSN